MFKLPKKYKNDKLIAIAPFFFKDKPNKKTNMPLFLIQIILFSECYKKYCCKKNEEQTVQNKEETRPFNTSVS